MVPPLHVWIRKSQLKTIWSKKIKNKKIKQSNRNSSKDKQALKLKILRRIYGRINEEANWKWRTNQKLQEEFNEPNMVAQIIRISWLEAWEKSKSSVRNTILFSFDGKKKKADGEKDYRSVKRFISNLFIHGYQP